MTRTADTWSPLDVLLGRAIERAIGTPDPGPFQAALATTWDVRTCLAGREIPRDIQPRDLQQVNPCQGCGGGSCTCRDGGGDHPARRP